LAQRAQHVLALDLSPEMIRVAQERSTRFNNIEYQIADVLKCQLPANQFDKAESVSDFALSIPAIPRNLLLRLWKQHRLRPPREVRAAWAEHGRTDVYPTLSQVRRSCETILPGAHLTRHLLWRYSIIWTKPA
jgi:hypothetical protein